MSVVLWIAGLPLLVWAAQRLYLTALALAAREPATPPARPCAVTVQLPLYNEAAVAARVIDAAARLRWPDLEIQVLDDSTDSTRDIVAERVASWAARGVDIVHLRRAQRTGFKAGALAHGLTLARGELVLVLDADFVPAPDLLERAVGHFADPRVAVVQVRWEHLNRVGPLAEAQALLLDGHFHVEQRARCAAGLFFNFNGTAGLWRRAAIDDAGGWSADTLTEDLDLSYRALLAGWRFVYLDSQAVPAELPGDMAAFRGQQYRWAKGALQCARKLLPRIWRADLPLAVKAEATLHLTSNLAYPLSLVFVLATALAAVLDAPVVGAPLLGVGALAYAAYHVAAQRGRAVWRRVLALPLVALAGASLLCNQTRAVASGLFGPVGEFVRTPKTGAVGARRLLAPAGARPLELVLAGLVVVAATTATQWVFVPMLGVDTIVLAWAGLAR